MRSRLGMTLTALLAPPAEAPAAPAALGPIAATTSGVDLRSAGSRLLPSGGHWAIGLALAFRH